ncbi:MAG: acyltransferase [Deltaproteobacteria bacterium]
MINALILKIKRKEGPFYKSLHELAKFILNFNLPSIRFIHLPLYYIHYFVGISTKRFIHLFWSVPLFKARCEKAGKNLCLPNGIPLVIGGHLRIIIGDNVTIGRSTLGANKVYDNPVLRIGNNTTIGYGGVISISKEIVIGDNCKISGYCLIMDCDDHPIDPSKRLLDLAVEKEDIKPVRIGNNVWIGAYATILKGVTIGDNSIISTHSVITRDVLPNCIYAGHPARPTLRDIDKLSDKVKLPQD